MPVCAPALSFVLFLLLVVVNCVVLDHPKNGFVSSSSTVEGGTATYSCKPGFVLEGEGTRTCTTVDSRYSGHPWDRVKWLE